MKRLEKQLGLLDTYAISTGAMFSSGFFLLPGIAAATSGPSVVLAYFLAALLVAPAMLSMAELCTALPRSGGTYFFLDRTLGPAVGTIGGLGTWLALALKTAFALIGMGAYLSLLVDVPIVPLALLLTALFALLNVAGAKESSAMQKGLVVALLVLLGAFVLSGLADVGRTGPAVVRERFTPFLPFGAEGLWATVGLVFVSYAGLLKVASVPEEVKDPDRVIPLAMGLSLLTAAVVYALGLFVMVAVLDPADLRASLTPVADAGAVAFSWLPGRSGVLIIVIAAVAAFSAMANAGVMAASRYPFAMARDRLVWEGFGRVSRLGTPAAAILTTSAIIAFFLVALDVESVAKLASALLLLVFALVNLAAIVMRESRIDAYDPGFRSPLYPWAQIVGLLVPLWLIGEMGLLAFLFTLGVTLAAVLWYSLYARDRVAREGAVYHVFERLGRRRFEGLDPELRQILKEKGLREEDPFEQVVARAVVVDRDGAVAFDVLADEVAGHLAGVVRATRHELAEGFRSGTRLGLTPVSHGVALPHVRIRELEEPRLAIVRCRGGIEIATGEEELAGAGAGSAGAGSAGTEARSGEEGSHRRERTEEPDEPIRAAFFLISPRGDPGRHLRLLAQIAGRADDEGFMEEWLAARNEQELKETVLRNDRYLSLRIRAGSPVAGWAGRGLRDIDLPGGTLVALVRRRGEVLVPGGDTVLEEEDRLTILGEPGALETLRRRLSSRARAAVGNASARDTEET